MKIRSVGTLCILAFVLICFLADWNQRPQVSFLRWFGLSINKEVLKHTLMVLVLNSVFFSGELFQLCRNMTELQHDFNDNTFIKTVVWAPIFEEFIYRACLINFFIETGRYSSTMIVLVTPLFFSISHVHHVIHQQRAQKKLKIVLEEKKMSHL